MKVFVHKMPCHLWRSSFSFLRNSINSPNSPSVTEQIQNIIFFFISDFLVGNHLYTSDGSEVPILTSSLDVLAGNYQLLSITHWTSPVFHRISLAIYPQRGYFSDPLSGIGLERNHNH